MKTQLIKAKNGITTTEMQQVAKDEDLSTDAVAQLIAARKLVIPANRTHTHLAPRAIGAKTRVKVNVNLGTSSDCVDVKNELKKVDLAHKYGADAIMDLSTGGDIPEIRQKIFEHTTLPLGTVPAYEAFEQAKRVNGDFLSLKASALFEVIRAQAKDGVDFMTLHCGITQHTLKRLQSHQRIMGIVSRGGSLLAGWMRHHKQENPLYEYYDELLDLAAEYDVTLSLGDALRPGCIADASDRGQIEELVMLGELADRAYQKGVQVIIEGPGHVPINQIAANIELQKTLCQGAPFYVLGPVVCDVAPGYDHITAAIGGSLAAFNGADFLCYVTPAEHLRLPTLEDVREGIMATKIAAFSADLAREKPYAVKRNNEIAYARRELDWPRMFQSSVDPERAELFYSSVKQQGVEGSCSMCGDLCAIKVGNNR